MDQIEPRRAAVQMNAGGRWSPAYARTADFPEPIVHRDNPGGRINVDPSR
jgi:hypothetical protein